MKAAAVYDEISVRLYEADKSDVTSLIFNVVISQPMISFFRTSYHWILWRMTRFSAHGTTFVALTVRKAGSIIFLLGLTSLTGDILSATYAENHV